MKKALLITLTALTLAACADTRSHVNSQSSNWETVKYQVGAEKAAAHDAPPHAACNLF